MHREGKSLVFAFRPNNDRRRQTLEWVQFYEYLSNNHSSITISNNNDNHDYNDDYNDDDDDDDDVYNDDVYNDHNQK